MSACSLGGIPFFQKHGTRMVDLVLVPEHETATVFEFTLGLDREMGSLTAQGDDFAYWPHYDREGAAAGRHLRVAGAH